MSQKFVLLMSVLVLAFGVAACGGDDEEPASGGGTTPAESTPSKDAGGGGGATDKQVEAAIEQCKSTIEAQPQLSDDLKGELEELCDKAGSGDVDDAREASVEVCKKIAEEMVPDEAAREQVIASCEKAAP